MASIGRASWSAPVRAVSDATVSDHLTFVPGLWSPNPPVAALTWIPRRLADLIEELGFSVESALEAFGESRPPGVKVRIPCLPTPPGRFDTHQLSEGPPLTPPSRLPFTA